MLDSFYLKKIKKNIRTISGMFSETPDLLIIFSIIIHGRFKRYLSDIKKALDGTTAKGLASQLKGICLSLYSSSFIFVPRYILFKCWMSFN